MYFLQNAAAKVSNLIYPSSGQFRFTFFCTAPKIFLSNGPSDKLNICIYRRKGLDIIICRDQQKKISIPRAGSFSPNQPFKLKAH